ncbi:MAG: winged helix-turn-helix domain-containing protein [Nitrosopumilus sp.]|nr:winged helix-turn-helix domain-containing protein [Nitrosopumilus sp.]
MEYSGTTPPRRDQVTIMTDLLENIEEPRRVTHLLYRSNMSYTQLVKYLNVLVDLGLAKENKEPFHAYLITKNGKTFRDLIKPNKSSELAQKVMK